LSEGAYVWLIPDGYIPEGSTGRQPSHEAICVLNPSGEEAHLSITFYFEDRVPGKDVRVTVPPERIRHIRTDLPVQHSRMDTSQEALALMTTMAHPVG
jgi:hypothetical protein